MKKIYDFNLIMNTSYDIYKKNYKSLVGYTIIMTIITYIFVSIVATIGGVIAIIPIMLSLGSIDEILVFIIVIAIVLIVMFPISGILYMPAVGSIKTIEAYREDKTITFGQMIELSFKHILYLITSSIAVWLVYIAIYGIGGGICILLYFVLPKPVSIILIVIISIITLIIGIYYTIKSAFFLQVAICEKRHFFGAVKRSFELSRNDMKKVTGSLFSISLSYYVVFYSLSYILYILITIVIVASMFLPFISIFIQMATSVIQYALAGVLTPILYINLTFLYYNQRNKKEGLDLQLRIDKLTEDYLNNHINQSGVVK